MLLTVYTFYKKKPLLINIKLTTEDRARTIGNANELTRIPIVIKIAASIQGEFVPPALSV